MDLIDDYIETTVDDLDLVRDELANGERPGVASVWDSLCEFVRSLSGGVTPGGLRA